ncbi:hypothetical protein C8A00DRAFT_32633 [Chaetomidium leptoderma]|uniref:Uncharacterized protein n=1 Tax=Chaetomidium leptoderma TaxID=669021 RepID=A0AAN6ZXL4_9PEZI|nr:hypothetical protein C8A00DRAFT_32633 [Chaetomidium leptoderma]
MGLRLYQPPVESDIQSKPPADRSARSRSTIRRVLDRSEDRVRERRRRVLAAAAAYNSFDARRGTATAEPASIPPATTDSTGTRWGGSEHRRALGETNRRVGILDDRVVAMFGERWAHLHAESNPSPLRDDDNDPSPMLTMAVEPEFMPRRTQLRPEPTYALSSIRSTQAPNHTSRRVSRPHATVWSRIRRRGNSESSIGSIHTASDGYQPRHTISRPSPWAIEAADLDGLGDRNRSLSPEGDNVWDTLLSTLAPDPQPPSVGSSFASASASAAATQSTAAASSRTSFTTMDAAAESAFEPPCESGCDNSDTEGDDDDDDDLLDQIPYGRGMANIRRHPTLFFERTRSNNEDPLELLGGIGGMQRIVRNLARREDIPDEWWADAGLSRTLSRESSEN